MITSYATLKSTLTDWLNRSDLTVTVETFIQLAEAAFKRDPRVRKLQSRGAFVITADEQALPSDFMSMEAWYHNGPTVYGRIEIVGSDALGDLKALHGPTGTPRHAAVVDGTVRFAPSPDVAYTTQMTYWRKIVALSDANTTNWLLAAYPDVYLYGALVESAPYLSDDVRVPVWSTQLEKRLNEVDAIARLEQFPEQPQSEDQRVTKARP